MVRFKYRYLVVAVNKGANNSNITKDGLSDCIRASINENFGDYGSGTLSPTFQIKHWNHETNIGIVRIAREHFRLLWAAITFVISIAGFRAVIRVVHVGGTIRSCYKNAAHFGLGELESGMAAATI